MLRAIPTAAWAVATSWRAAHPTTAARTAARVAVQLVQRGMATATPPAAVAASAPALAAPAPTPMSAAAAAAVAAAAPIAPAAAPTAGAASRRAAAVAALRRADAVAFDVDSTVITVEAIDEFAGFMGKREEVAAQTAAAMGGSVPFDVALERRLGLLRPTAAHLAGFLAAHPFAFTPGVREVVAALRARGTAVYLVSGGFTQVCVLGGERGAGHARAHHPTCSHPPPRPRTDDLPRGGRAGHSADVCVRQHDPV